MVVLIKLFFGHGCPNFYYPPLASSILFKQAFIMKQVLAFSFVFAVGCLLSFVITPDYSVKGSQIIAVPTLRFADGSVYVGELDSQGLLSGKGKP
jgi:hypothetical protein